MSLQPTPPIAHTLRDLDARSQMLTDHILEFSRYTAPETNRRNPSGAGFPLDRRRGERREPERSTCGRRELDDRRTPAESRLEEWHTQLRQVLEESVRISVLQRGFHHKSPARPSS